MTGLGIGISPIFQTKAGLTYVERVLSYSPIVYYPLSETSGTTADNAEGTADRDGTYTGVTLNDITGPDGVNGAPYFDGANDFVDIYSASLNSAFDPDLFTVFFWLKSGNNFATTSERAYRLAQDGSNEAYTLTISGTEVRLYFEGTGKHADLPVADVLDTWFNIAVTVDVVADELKGYKNGSQIDTTQTGIGTWVGGLTDSICCIGASSTGPTNPFNGWLAHFAVFPEALEASEILDLATV